MDKLTSKLLVGNVWHKRMTGAAHAFRYRVFYMLLDLDMLPALARRLRFFSLNRFNLFSLYPGDYAAGGAGDLKSRIEAKLYGQVPDWRGGRILLMTMPRVLGYAFNPISIFYCYAPGGALQALVYEVHNTFGETHHYVFPAPRASARHSCAKRFYVSPFFGVEGSYRFSNHLDGDQLNLLIRYQGPSGEERLRAGLRAHACALTDRMLLKLFCAIPLVTGKVILGIHYEALKLWLKKLPLFPRPKAKPLQHSV